MAANDDVVWGEVPDIVTLVSRRLGTLKSNRMWSAEKKKMGF